MSRRSRAREVAVQVLFQDDLNPGLNPAETDAFLLRRLRGFARRGTSADGADETPTPAEPMKITRGGVEAGPWVPSRSSPFEGLGKAAPSPADEPASPSLAAVIEFARSLVSGVRRNRRELDELLGNTADNWKLERMAATDRNILRVGAFELLYTDTPGAVVINEAVELAKRYGTANSAQFVNGILDKLHISHRKTNKP